MDGELRTDEAEEMADGIMQDLIVLADNLCLEQLSRIYLAACGAKSEVEQNLEGLLIECAV